MSVDTKEKFGQSLKRKLEKNLQVLKELEMLKKSRKSFLKKRITSAAKKMVAKCNDGCILDMNEDTLHAMEMECNDDIDELRPILNELSDELDLNLDIAQKLNRPECKKCDGQCRRVAPAVEHFIEIKLRN